MRSGGQASLLRLWFGLSYPVGRRAYALWGLGLMVFKYALDTTVVAVATGRIWTPLDYLSPFLLAREAPLRTPPTSLIWTLMALAIPFLWIGVSMSIRRAVDAGLSPWVGCLFFVPVVNYLMMLVLCVLPSAGDPAWIFLHQRVARADRFRPFFLSAAAGAAVALGLIALSVHALRSYGVSLFLGAPFLSSFVVGFLYNRTEPRTEWATVAAAQLSLLMTGGALLSFALEGLVCVVMAYPLAAVVVTLGATMGRVVALQPHIRGAHVGVLLLALPLLMGAESQRTDTRLREVVSAIEVDAPPQAVWPLVVGFSELPPPSRWVFRLGIAYPERASMEGRGVGAVRRCEFSTGPFIEPITGWEEPSRLSFDVQSQPPPLHEWSPYRHVNAPHLIGTLRARRGEFRLRALGSGRTRLEGSTWYELAMFPQAYWTLWSDALIHAIHERVLAHIKQLAETGRRG